jgi:hypothetical protein
LDLPVFCGERLQRLNIQGLLRHHLFQPLVFLFLLTQFLHAADFQAGVFRPPLIIEGSIRGALPPAQVLNTLAGLGILQRDDNLTLGMTFSCHGLPLSAYHCTIGLPDHDVVIGGRSPKPSYQ